MTSVLTVTAPRVAGIDISLTSTGVATLAGTTAITSVGHRTDDLATRQRRLTLITGRVLTAVGTVDLAVVEGPSHHSVGGSVWDRAGLWWRITTALMSRQIPVAVVPPSCRAKYATGSGAARKAAVLAAVAARYGVTPQTDDEADALVLRAMGLDRLGHPLAEVPSVNRGVLDACQWPDAVEAVVL